MVTNTNPLMEALQPYPVEKMQHLFKSISPHPSLKHIDLSIGEPKHTTPDCIRNALISGLDGLSRYPTTRGNTSLREAISDWLQRRYKLTYIRPNAHIIPTQGSREALFSLAQTVLDGSRHNDIVLCPNPFYQIYEGAALLAGLRPYYINMIPQQNYRLDWSAVPRDILQRTQMIFTCSPSNPNGSVMSLNEWSELFALSDKYGFIIAADECYTEIYFDEQNPPLGALQAAEQLGRNNYKRLIVLGSLSKRSNVPGLRSGFAAGDASIIEQFIRYRTYHGSAMGDTIQIASRAAWEDEKHVLENRDLYRRKFDVFFSILSPVLPLKKPHASFYYWIETPIDDQVFAVQLLHEVNVKVLPGSLLARAAHGTNPGKNHIRIALVATMDETIEAAYRIRDFVVNNIFEGKRSAIAHLKASPESPKCKPKPD